jgi:hypothetical protein
MIAELKTRITPPMWPFVIGAIGSASTVYVDIKPELEEKEPPAYHTVTASPSDGENQSIVVLSFDKDNRAFVAPGSTLHVRSCYLFFQLHILIMHELLGNDPSCQINISLYITSHFR